METFKTFKKWVLVSIFLFTSVNLFAQFSDDFSDKDLQNTPAWKGDLQDFVINENLQLQLNAAASGSSYLVTSSQVLSGASWEFYFRFDFNPSSQNFSKVYLYSDNSDLVSTGNGYFVMIGGSTDEISLYGIENGVVSKLIDGLDGQLNSLDNAGKIKVTRNEVGNWELFTALADTSVFTKEGEIIDNRNFPASYFGIYCEYTSTRSDKFYFDDIVITGSAYADTTPPALVSVKAISSHRLEANFSEPLDPGITTQLTNFEIQPDIGYAQKIEFNDNPAHLEIQFERPFSPGKEYLFKASNVADIIQNISPPISATFLFFIPVKAAFRDVVINEIMPDPTPVIGLPEAEFIEIYNRSNKTIELADWVISDKTNSGRLKAGAIFPGEYVVLCEPSDSSVFATYGKVIPVSGFPSLNNDSDDLYLRNAVNENIDEVLYTKNWYKSSLRSNGGYSLEMIDSSNPCSSEENWKVSEHPDGGTPGKINSIQSSKPDNSGPKLQRIFPEKDSLLLIFNENLDPASVITAQYFLNDKPIGPNAYLGAIRNEVILNLEDPLEEKVKYALVVKNIRDCIGNFVDETSNSLSFSLPEAADSVDIIINEVLFNPNTGGVDFVEIYNNSEKYIDLKGWNLANVDIEKESGNPIIANRKIIFDENYLFTPGEFLVLTPDRADILKNYPRAANNTMISMSSFPSYPDDEGSVVILNKNNLVIDRFDYHEKYHSPIISEQDGVSLERIAYHSPTQDSHNWTSAASTIGFATPGESNSQSRSLRAFSGSISVSPKVIIPNNDGSRDFTTIEYFFDHQSYIGNIYVFDINGNKISTIARDQTFPKEGFFSWEGTGDNGEKLDLGIYMIFIEVFDFNGAVKTFKEPIVIGSNF